ncbi:MAG: hypothetical protein CVU61_11690 [Deltaproteobacteria bacterium HGW-Deltaproteobacteria-19]|jgi:hypothetical protein|nr:MAG: hypothetical protein CVU61_11690 [Deltaproteobacteria bacterium HGW-Deltaproteobacteria-19]
MKPNIFVFAMIMILFSMPLSAGEIYTYTDEHGNTILSDTPPPRSSRIKIKHTEPNEQLTSEDRQALEKERSSRQKAWEDEKARRDKEPAGIVEADEKARTETKKK